MEDADVLLRKLNATKERYDTLRDLFLKFYEHISESKGDERLNIFTITPEENTLYIGFLDRKIKAKFSFFVDANGRQEGHIHCQLLSPIENNKPKFIQNFSFDGHGLTNIPYKDNEDPYYINIRAHALTILFNWATISVK